MQNLRMTLTEAAEKLQIRPQLLGEMILEGKFHWASGYRKDRERAAYVISRKQFNDFYGEGEDLS